MNDKSKLKHILIIIGCLLILFPVLTIPESDSQPTSASLRLKWYQDHLQMKKNSIFKNYKWKFIGPVWMSGRITDIEVPLNQHYTIYVATASGGVWKTDNEGTTWNPIFEDALSTSIGDMAISESDPNIIWIGTGENNSSRSSYSGTGVYKSVDHGKNWQHMGLYDTHHIGRIIIHPGNPNIIYVAALGHLYSYNNQRGIFRSGDGGITWERILFINEKTGFIDLVMDPSDTDILYAAAWQRLRKAWNMWESGPGSAIYKTIDGGVSWEKCSGGFTRSQKIGRIGLAIAGSNSKVVYALIDNHEIKRKGEKGEMDPYGFKLENVIKGAEVYRSNNRGHTWIKANRQDITNLYYTYGYYFGEIRVDPQNENIIYLLGVPLLKSNDGGKTFTILKYRNLHGDHQALWIDPQDSHHLINGNDGGLNFSYDDGVTWRDINNLPVVQFYNISYDLAKPFQVLGSAQDHGCFRGPVSHDPTIDDPGEWKKVIGGEASYIEIDRVNPNILYSEGTYGELYRVNLKQNRKKNIKPKVSENKPPLRCNWLTPFIISPHKPSTIYYGSQYIFKSIDRGGHWVQISPDLTKNCESQRGDVPFATITSISESEIKTGLIYVGTDDGNVQVTHNNGAQWELINHGLPENKWISRIQASKFDLKTVYVSLNGYRDDDFRTYLFRSKDFGKTWENIGNNIPGSPVNVVKEDPQNHKIIYVGTDLGVYITLDNARTWYSLCGNIPTVYVHDLVVHPRDKILVIATHGRGMFKLDVSPIQNFNEKINKKSIHIFPIQRIVLSQNWEQAKKQAHILFFLQKSQNVIISILNSKGKTVKQIAVKAEKGFNSSAWDLSINGESEIKHIAKPGLYTVQVATKELKDTEVLELKQSET